MANEAFNEAFKLLVLGMGGVFIFLAVLVFLMNCSAKFFTAFGHLFPDKPTNASAPANNNAEEEIAVALVAIRAKM